MRRVLSAEERALWRRVTADVRTRAGPVDDAAAPALRPALSGRPASPPPPQATAVMRRLAPRPAHHSATLDGKWDRDLKAGRVSPDRVVDLHGCTLAQAHEHILSALEAAIAAHDRLVVVVTGRAPGAGTSRLDRPLRGIIRASVADWLHGAPFAGRIAAIRPAHARHGGAGALYVILRRSDRP